MKKIYGKSFSHHKNISHIYQNKIYEIFIIIIATKMNLFDIGNKKLPSQTEFKIQKMIPIGSINPTFLAKNQMRSYQSSIKLRH